MTAFVHVVGRPFASCSTVTLASPSSASAPVNRKQASSGHQPRPLDPQKPALKQIAELPRDVGWNLLIAGFLSELGVPGVPPVWVIGLLILWPRFGAPIGACLQRRTPNLFESCIRMISRYAHDLEHRYPRR